MLLGYSVAQVRAAEAPHLAAGEPLMQRAARGLADAISVRAQSRAPRSDTAAVVPLRVLVLAGSGDNGGDALYAAGFLAEEGGEVRIIEVGSRVHESALAFALAAGARRGDGDTASQATLATWADVIVDGILGTGASAHPALRGAAREAVMTISALIEERSEVSQPLVVAVDLPSGVGADDGSVPDPTVLRADVTVTFGGIKAGLLLAPAASLAGEIVLVDIGIADELAGLRPTVRQEG